MAQKLTKGDVLLIEVDSNRGVLELPIEAFPLGFAAINAAHEAGIYVVEAAGNGGLELTKNLGIDPFGPALLIGAGNPATGKATAFSNFGERVDLQGWGLEVVTTGAPFQGFDDLQRRSDKNACYMRSFDGTSSAAAIVASCVASISSILRSHALDLPTPSALRTLLNKRGTFTDQAANGGIGALPNLKAALDDLEQAVGGGFRFDRI